MLPCKKVSQVHGTERRNKIKGTNTGKKSLRASYENTEIAHCWKATYVFSKLLDTKLLIVHIPTELPPTPSILTPENPTSEQRELPSCHLHLHFSVLHPS